MQNNIILYTTTDGKASVELYEFGESLYLAQNAIAELFATSKQNVSLHIQNILKDGELDENSVVKEYLTTAKDGKSYMPPVLKFNNLVLTVSDKCLNCCSINYINNSVLVKVGSLNSVIC